MNTIQTLYSNLVATLAAVLAHTETPETFRRECLSIVRPLAFHAGVEVAEIAAKCPGAVAGLDFRKVALEFGLAAAAVMDDPEADEYLRHELTDLTLNMEGMVKPEGCVRTFGARLRGILTAYAGLSVEPVGESALAITA